MEKEIKALEDALARWDNHYGHSYKRKRGAMVRYTFITGGWSENEAIQSKLDRNRNLNLFFWVKSERGGLTIYEVTQT